jgi:3-hydroxyisobutyrate dehydrogenase-like beta-hydroxyacid dehydrogenase
LAAIGRCAGTSLMLESRAPQIVAGDGTPHSALGMGPKDLGIVLDVPRCEGRQQFLAAARSGLGCEDDATVVKVYVRNAGLELQGEDRTRRPSDS